MAGFYLTQQKQQAVAQPAEIHYANRPSLSISHITIKAFYFVPKNLEDELDGSWQEALDKVLLETKQFYDFQLQQRSNIVYEIYPQPIIGLASSKEYDGKDTGHGNPNALLAIQKELNERVFDSKGDLYQKPFSEIEPEEYSIISILYEGVGASAMMYKTSSGFASDAVNAADKTIPAFLVSRYFLSSKNYSDFGDSIFAHEMGHMLGLPDGYDPQTGDTVSEDIMGAGRFRPLKFTYLSAQAKIKLGIIY